MIKTIIQALYSVHLFRFKQFVLDIILMQVVVLLLVLGLCSVEGMRKRKRNRNQQQGRRGGAVGQYIYIGRCSNEIVFGEILVLWR